MLTRSQARKRRIDVPSESLPRSSQRRRRFVVEDSDDDVGPRYADQPAHRSQVVVMLVLSVTWLAALAVVVAATVLVMQHCTSAHTCKTAVAGPWTAAWQRTTGWTSTVVQRAAAYSRGFL